MPQQKNRIRAARFDDDLNRRVERATKDGGFANPSGFIRAAIEGELAGRESGVESEARIAASFDRLLREVRGIKLAQQALFAFIDALSQNAPDVSGRTAPRYVRSSHCARPTSVRPIPQESGSRD